MDGQVDTRWLRGAGPIFNCDTVGYGQAAAVRTTYAFDANGNQQLEVTPAGARTTTIWDYENQPTLYKLAAGTRVTMAYNAANQRIRKET